MITAAIHGVVAKALADLGDGFLQPVLSAARIRRFHVEQAELPGTID